MLDLPVALERLALRRPVFHSKADFQHEFAWEIRSIWPKIEVRLERPLDDALGATDLVITTSSHVFGIELKFCSKVTERSWSDEVFKLKQHGAHPLRRYDICKDVQRMEAFHERYRAGSAVIVLTNDSAYWNPSNRGDVCDDAFRISDDRTLEGCLKWGDTASEGTRRKRESSIGLAGSYKLRWKPYSRLAGKAGQFQYLLINVV